ncbi:hypothetical protein [Cesiribacter sp. SM1]|uniref:hypothetical protein n=1 Tax=Cesiribacter sp. SM1 TaxID=2861196 RepID=UPI001CD2EDCA|nr:hypothetical protein [Cesiribacter sp. SM1]
MKKQRIIFTVIIERDGSFSAIGHTGKNNSELIAAQGDSWAELKKETLKRANLYLEEKGKSPLAAGHIDYSFDLPSFFDAYPQMDVSHLSQLKGEKHSRTKITNGSKNNVADRQLYRILDAVQKAGTLSTHNSGKIRK